MKPARCAASGRARWLASSTSDISPNINLKANAGTGKIAGRCTASAKAAVNSRLVTGKGEVALNTPRTVDSFIRKAISATRSSMWIHDIHWSSAAEPSPYAQPERRKHSRQRASVRPQHHADPQPRYTNAQGFGGLRFFFPGHGDPAQEIIRGRRRLRVRISSPREP